MLALIVSQMLLRDLDKLKEELQLYKHEANMWIVDRNITNPAGNLCLHLTGNLRYYIGSVLGNSEYHRNREEEFSLKNIPRKILLQQVDESNMVIKKTLAQLTDEQLAMPCPVPAFGPYMTTSAFLVHLAIHLGYHLGQINYHRRLLDVDVK